MPAQRSRQLIFRARQHRPRRRALNKQTLAVLDALPARIAILDARGMILSVNAAWRRFAEANGYAGQGAGLSYLEICQSVVGVDARAAGLAIRAVGAQDQAEHSFEYPFPGSDRPRWFLFRAVRVAGADPIRVLVSHEELPHDRHGKQGASQTAPVEFNAITHIVPGVQLSVLRDVSARRQPEAALRDQAARLNVLHEIDQIILSAESLEQLAQSVLRVIYRLIPYWRASVIVFDFDLGEFELAAVCHNGEPLEIPTRRFAIAENAEAETILPALQRGEPYVYDLHELAPRWPAAAQLLAVGMRYQTYAPLIAQGELFGSMQIAVPNQEFFDSMYMPIIREILDSLAIGVRQVGLLEQVRAGRERRRELSRRLVVAQELERRQLAGELHDRIGQNLAVLNMHLTSMRSHLSREAARRVEGQLAEAIHLVDQTVEQVRNVMAELRPAILDDFGLVAALRWYTRHCARHTDLVVLLEVEEPRAAPRLPPDLETALFRIAQEALTNVLKHARATLATLTLTTIEPMIRLEIADDGVGFKPGAPARPTPRWSLGLMTMQERVEAVGGRLVIESVPGQGTRIIAEVARYTYADQGIPGR